MKKLTELAINRPLLITVIFIILLLFGFISYNSLSYNLLPKFDAPVLSIITTYRGASAEEIESTITKEIEDAVSSIEGIDKLNASSMEGASLVIVQFLNGTDINNAQIDAQRKIAQIMSTLPKDVNDPIINKFSTDDMPVLTLGASASVDDKTFYDILDLQIKPQLATIKGVGRVDLIGGNSRQIMVNVNKDKAEFYGLTVAQVGAFVNAASLSTPAGKVETLDNEFTIKYDAKVGNVEQLKNMIVFRSPDGSNVYLKDVAEVVDGQVKATTINHTNGIPSIGIQILKQSDANAVEVTALLKKRLQDLKEKEFNNIGFDYNIASDQSVYTLKSADSVMVDLILAIIIVSIVMLVFLHSARSSFIVLVALPASMIPTFIAMYAFDMSLNLMTLMALSLVVGILVDDSIVILENIMRHMEMGKNKRQATIDGRSEIGFTAMSITLVDVVVFLPMAMAGGMIGNILREFALVVVFSTLMSLFVCFTLTPLFASRWGKLVHLDKATFFGRISLWFEGIITGMRDWYTNALKWSLGHKRYIFIGVILLFIGTIGLLAGGFVGASFMSKGDQGELVIKLELDPNVSVYQTNMATQDAEKIIMEEAGVDLVFANVGFSNTGMGSVSNSNYAEIMVKLVDKKERTYTIDDFSNRMQERISQIPGVKVTIGQVSLTGNADQAPIQFVFKSNNREDLRVAALKAKDIITKVNGTEYVEFSTKDAKPQIDVQLNREKMAMYGLNASQVGNALGSAFRGNDMSKYKFNGNEYDILVTADDYDKSNIDDVRNLSFINNSGQKFSLSQFATVIEEMGESVLQRQDRLPSITINSGIQGRSAGTIGDEIKQAFEATEWGQGVSWKAAGQLEMQEDSFSSLLLALGIGILLVYLIMVALYENAIYPFVVLMALPLAIIGSVLALALTMNELTIFAMIGIIMLMGLVAKNGILLVDFTNQRKAEGASLVDALLDAGRERFRPIMMTTIAMVAGMMPIALASGSGAEVKNGMAWVIIGGLTSSLILTLVVVPCVYYLVDKVLDRFRGRRRRKLKRKVIERNAARMTAAH